MQSIANTGSIPQLVLAQDRIDWVSSSGDGEGAAEAIEVAEVVVVEEEEAEEAEEAAEVVAEVVASLESEMMKTKFTTRVAMRINVFQPRLAVLPTRRRI